MKSNSDITSFDQLYADYKNRFMRFAITYVEDDMIAEDIVIDSFMYYWENRKKLKADLNIPAYILTIIKHKCLNHLQHLRVTQEATKYLKECDEWEVNLRILSLEACNPENIFYDELKTIIDRTFMTLPKQTREIFLRSRENNHSYKKIAEDLGISIKTVEFHISKALKIFRIALKDYFPIIIL